MAHSKSAVFLHTLYIPQAYLFDVYAVLILFRNVDVFRSDGELDAFTDLLNEDIIIIMIPKHA